MKSLNWKAGTEKNVGLLHLDIHVLYGSVEEDVMLVDRDTDVIIDIFTKTSLFPSASIFEATKIVLTDLRDFYELDLLIEHNSYQLCMTVKLQAMQGQRGLKRLWF